MTNAEKFKQMFGFYATELWSMSEEDFLYWLNSTADLPKVELTDDQVLSRTQKSWRDLPMTKKQRICIEDMMEFSQFSIPAFRGSTRGEASDYIDKYKDLAFTDVNSPMFGY